MTHPNLNSRIGSYRWVICSLLFFATTVNYIDRLVLGILATDLQKAFVWDDVVYGYINVAFQGAYGAGLLIAGGLMDRFGTRRGFAVAVGAWSIVSMTH